MKATSPPRATVSSLNYRDASATPVKTAPELVALSSSALSLLARYGTPAEAGNSPGDRIWSLSARTPSGVRMEIKCTGPDLPESIPPEMAHPSVIPFERPWVGTYRLVVRAPLIVLDLYWRPDSPMRIMGFSRGDWENELESATPSKAGRDLSS